MKHIKSFKINESLTNQELAEELKSGASWIEPSLNGTNWGVVYYKNKEKKKEGAFNSSEEVYDFLDELGVDYRGKEGHQLMKNYRNKEIDKQAFPAYQKYLLKNGLKDFIIE